ncbi:MAG: 50S ribosomal protein L1 [Verrucomicrobiota bacterium]
MSKRGKTYKQMLENFDRTNRYTLDEACDLLKNLPARNFEETVELALKLGIDPKRSEQAVRGAVTLPQGSGQEKRVAVVASGDAATAAKDAGADYVGFEEMIQQIKDGWLDFDALIATPDAMNSLRPLGKVLGPRGLMPNPKTGTLTDDTASAVKEAKAGKVEYRSDRGGCVHAPIGKKSFSVEALKENAVAVIEAVRNARPSDLKGTYLLSVTISSTMSPGIRIDTQAV